jgi:hypothetical protein
MPPMYPVRNSTHLPGCTEEAEPGLGVFWRGRMSALLAVRGEDASASPSDDGRLRPFQERPPKQKPRPPRKRPTNPPPA